MSEKSNLSYRERTRCTHADNTYDKRRMHSARAYENRWIINTEKRYRLHGRVHESFSGTRRDTRSNIVRERIRHGEPQTPPLRDERRLRRFPRRKLTRKNSRIPGSLSSRSRSLGLNTRYVHDETFKVQDYSRLPPTARKMKPK